MATVDRDIKYVNRDFSDIRAKLIEFSKTYFPNTYNDFSPTSNPTFKTPSFSRTSS